MKKSVQQSAVGNFELVKPNQEMKVKGGVRLKEF
jgi:hypothetical protein